MGPVFCAEAVNSERYIRKLACGSCINGIRRKLLKTLPSNIYNPVSHTGANEDNIKVDVEEIGYKFFDWIRLAQDMEQWRAVLNKVITFRVP
jgi:hypothetical protein